MNIFETTAFSLGARLCRDAIWFEKRCNWIGPFMEPRRTGWTVITKTLGADLYAGTAGVGWFLARLYALTGDRLIGKTAVGALEHACAQEGANGQMLSFYSGTMGIGCALIEAGEQLRKDSLVERGLALIGKLQKIDLAAQGLDVVGGLAGAIPPLLRIHESYAQPAALELAVRCGEHLAEQAHRDDKGWSWTTISDGSMPNLTGFSHGSAGFGWAFLELFRTTRDNRYRQWAEQAFAYEWQHFSASQGNWLDLRSTVPSPSAPTGRKQYACSMAWCHGAPGIGLSRLRAYELTGDEVFRREAEIALNTTWRSLEDPQAIGAGFSLCHGSAGNAELLLEGARVLGKPPLRVAAENLGVRAAQAFEMTGQPWNCGVTGAGETPALLLGLAGIGYFYLRLHNTGTENLLCYGPRATEAAAKPL
jgi:lantibiotic modifying enzyme